MPHLQWVSPHALGVGAPTAGRGDLVIDSHSQAERTMQVVTGLPSSSLHLGPPISFVGMPGVTERTFLGRVDFCTKAGLLSLSFQMLAEK